MINVIVFEWLLCIVALGIFIDPIWGKHIIRSRVSCGAEPSYPDRVFRSVLEFWHPIFILPRYSFSSFRISPIHDAVSNQVRCKEVVDHSILFD